MLYYFIILSFYCFIVVRSSRLSQKLCVVRPFGLRLSSSTTSPASLFWQISGRLTAAFLAYLFGASRLPVLAVYFGVLA